MKFRKRPVIIEAVKFHNREYADNPLVFDEIPKWLQEAVDNKTIIPEFRSEDYWYLNIQTLEGTMSARPDDWIIQGVNGEIYPCKPDIFEKTYEKVSDEGKITN